VTEDLKDHADVSAVDAADLEVVKKLDATRPEGILLVTLSNAFEQFDLVQGRFCVVNRTFHHFEGDKFLFRKVPSQPDSGEVARRPHRGWWFATSSRTSLFLRTLVKIASAVSVNALWFSRMDETTFSMALN